MSKKTVTFRCDAAVADEIRSFARSQAGAPLYMTLSSFLQTGAEVHLKRMKHELLTKEKEAHG